MIRPVGIIVCFVSWVILSIVVSFQQTLWIERERKKVNRKVKMGLTHSYYVSSAQGSMAYTSIIIRLGVFYIMITVGTWVCSVVVFRIALPME